MLAVVDGSSPIQAQNDLAYEESLDEDSTSGHYLFVEACVESIAANVRLLQHMARAVRYSSTSRQNKCAAESLDTEGAKIFKAVALHLIEDKFPEASPHLKDRLALSMVVRRNRLQYRRDRFQDQAVHLSKPSREPEALPRSQGPSTFQIAITETTTQESGPSGLQEAHYSPSVVRTATTVNQERYLNYAEHSSILNPTYKLADVHDFQYPPIPKASDGNQRICPYCWLHLNDAESRSNSSWLYAKC